MITLHIEDAEVVRTGADGGHAYIKGHCVYQDKLVPVTALMADRTDEAALRPGSLTLSGEMRSFVPGAGLLLHACTVTQARS